MRRHDEYFDKNSDLRTHILVAMERLLACSAKIPASLRLSQFSRSTCSEGEVKALEDGM
jgi:hypothetical protein